MRERGGVKDERKGRSERREKGEGRIREGLGKDKRKGRREG